MQRQGEMLARSIDSEERFLGGHQYGGHTLAGPPKRTINDVVNAAARNAITTEERLVCE